MAEPKTILIVEDDFDFRQTLVNLLASNGYLVDDAADGERAIMMVADKKYDLIIVDVRLPGRLDGLDVLIKAKEETHYRGAMIVMTGYAEQGAPVRAVKIGVQYYVYKPFEAKVFLDMVKKSLKI
jgi:DNA-binding response OmpR family regulator